MMIRWDACRVFMLFILLIGGIFFALFMASRLIGLLYRLAGPRGFVVGLLLSQVLFSDFPECHDGMNLPEKRQPRVVFKILFDVLVDTVVDPGVMQRQYTAGPDLWDHQPGVCTDPLIIVPGIDKCQPASVRYRGVGQA